MAKTFVTQDPNEKPVAVNQSQAERLRGLQDLSQQAKELLENVSDTTNEFETIDKKYLDEIREKLESIKTLSEDIETSWEGSLEDLKNVSAMLKEVSHQGREIQDIRKGSMNLTRQMSAEIRRQYSMQITGEGLSQQTISARRKVTEGLKLDLESTVEAYNRVIDSNKRLTQSAKIGDLWGDDIDGAIRVLERKANNENLSEFQREKYRQLLDTARAISANKEAVDSLESSVARMNEAWEQSIKTIGQSNGKLDAFAKLSRKVGLGGLAEQIIATKRDATTAYNKTYLATEGTSEEKDKKAKAAYDAIVGDLGSFNGLLRTAGTQLKGMLTSWTIIVGLGLAFFHQLLKFDEQAVKTKRVIGQWADASALANTKFVTGTEVLKTMAALGEQFKFNTAQVFSGQELGRITQAQKLTGMSADAAGNLAVQSKIIGKNADTYRDSIAAGANSANKINHSAVNLSAVQNDVLTTSRAIALSYGKNVEALAKAAGSAAALGMNLQDVENIAKNLMNFESSIESEMQAQLLTGQQLNLAKAREYSLNNDLEGVTREIGRQGVDAASWGRMNYIQQENMAKALGMSREQMAKMLIMQQINSGLTAKQVAAMTGMRRKDIEALSAQEKWQTMKQRFLESLVPLLEPILQITSDVLRLLSPIVGAISWLAGKISTLFGWIPENMVLLRALSTLVIGIGVTIGVNWIRGLRGVALLGTRIGGIFSNLGKSISDTWRVMTHPAAMARLQRIRAAGGTVGGGAASAASSAAPTAARGVGGMSKLFSGIGKNIGKIALGAAAMAIMSLALIGIAKALQMLKDVEWKQFGMMAASLGVLAGMVMVLGAIMMSGWGAAAFMLGTVALTGLALAMGVVGIAVRSLGEGLQSIPTGVELGSIASGITSIAEAVGNLALKLKDLSPRKLRALGRAFRNLKGSNIQVSNFGESGGSLESPREDIETAVQGITIKQAQVQASAQQISIEQKAADLSIIERKLDTVVKVIQDSRPDWNWLEFKREMEASY